MYLCSYGPYGYFCNMTWIKHPTLLNGDAVRLLPLVQEHFDELAELSKEKRIWQFIPADMSSKEKVFKALEAAIGERNALTQYPFAIFHKKDERLIGSTRLMNIEERHRKLEIGWTWLHPDYWATEVNLECKLLLLTFCFEELGAYRVQLKTDEHNIRSRKAIEKIGGKFEGILRNDMVRDNGTKRNTAYFSITEAEWADAKIKLTDLLRTKRQIAL